MKRIIKSDLDKFYTKESLSKYLIKKIDFSKYRLIIDPSCGDGAFFNHIPHDNKIAIDIDPKIEEAFKIDFLKWTMDLDFNPSDVLTISNPPFGKQGSLALKFIKKASEFSDSIAFILPLSFKKPSVKNKIPEYYHLKYEEILPEESYILNGETYNVKSVFQLWEKRNTKREKIEPIKETGFKYTKNPKEAHLSIRRVGVYAGKPFLNTDKSKQSHYFIILDDETKKDIIIKELKHQEFIDMTVGPRSISKSELNEKLNNILKTNSKN